MVRLTAVDVSGLMPHRFVAKDSNENTVHEIKKTILAHVIQVQERVLRFSLTGCAMF